MAETHDNVPLDSGPEDSTGAGVESSDESNRPWHTKNDNDAADPKKKGSFLRELVTIVGTVLVVMFLLSTFVTRQYVIPSESMENTLHGCTGCSNDRILIDKISYRFHDPRPGDVIVFKGPTDSWNDQWESPRSSNPVLRTVQNVASWFMFAPPNENDLVKRVIAVGGQTVECHAADGVGVKVNGKALSEPYIDKALQERNGMPGPCYGNDFGPVTVPQGNVWVMGDNRGNSADSRYHMAGDPYQGTVPISDVRGKVRFIIYPFSRFGGIGDYNPQQ